MQRYPVVLGMPWLKRRLYRGLQAIDQPVVLRRAGGFKYHRDLVHCHGDPLMFRFEAAGDQVGCAVAREPADFRAHGWWGGCLAIRGSVNQPVREEWWAVNLGVFHVD